MIGVVQFVHEGLGNSSYLIDIGNGRGLLIDPDRSFSRYARAADDRGISLIASIETHVHADFVSGSREAAASGGSAVFLPLDSGATYAHLQATPEQAIELEGLRIETLATPGHTPEHMSYVIRQASGPPLLFSGGSLIVGGAARTDLIASELTARLTKAQFRTLMSAFKDLPDDTVLYPTHGGGSFCSTGAGLERTSTLGQERRLNPLLQFEDEEDFADFFVSTFPSTPAYYDRMRGVNQAGPRLRRELFLPPDADAAAEYSLVIDARSRKEYASRHISGSLSIPFRPAFCVWVGWLVPPEATVAFVRGGVPLDTLYDESLLVGHESFAGSVGLDGHDLRRTTLLDAAGARRVLSEGAVAIDVREPDEFAAGHIPGAKSVPLGSLQGRLDEIPRDGGVLLYCGVGDRASTGISLLERAGIEAMNLDGGFGAWREAGAPVEY